MEGIFDTIPNTNKRAEIVHEETCELPSKSDGFHTPPRAISIMAPPSRSKYAGSSPTTETHERNKDEERREIRALYSLGAPEIDEVNQSNTKVAQKAGCTSSSGDQKEESKTSAKVLEVDNNIVSAWDHLSKISSQKVVQDPQNSEMQDYANHLYAMFPPVPKNDPSNHPRYRYPPGEWEKIQTKIKKKREKTRRREKKRQTSNQEKKKPSKVKFTPNKPAAPRNTENREICDDFPGEMNKSSPSASQAKIARAKNNKNPKQYENFNLPKYNNSENPSKTEILREEKRGNAREGITDLNLSTPADRPVRVFDEREAEEREFSSATETIPSRPKNPNKIIPINLDDRIIKEETKKVNEEERNDLRHNPKVARLDYTPAPKRTGCGIKIDQAALASLQKNATYQFRPSSAPAMGGLEAHQQKPPSRPSTRQATPQKNQVTHQEQLNQVISPQYLFPPHIGATRIQVQLLPHNPFAAKIYDGDEHKGGDNDKYQNDERNFDDDKLLTVCQEHAKGDLLSPQYLHPPNPSASLDPTDQTPSKTSAFRVHANGDHLSPQYLHPPNPSNRRKTSNEPMPQNIPGDHLSPQHLHQPNLGENRYLLSPNFRITINPPDLKANQYLFEVHVHGDHLSPQYLHPPNPSSKHGCPSKEPTSRNFPGSAHHQVTQNLSPQYLYPPNFQPAPHQCPYIIKPAFENSEQDRDLGDQNLSPQYLFPPNFWSPSPPSEPTAKQQWGVAALALLKSVERAAPPQCFSVMGSGGRDGLRKLGGRDTVGKDSDLLRHGLV